MLADVQQVALQSLRAPSTPGLQAELLTAGSSTILAWKLPTAFGNDMVNDEEMFYSFFHIPY